MGWLIGVLTVVVRIESPPRPANVVPLVVANVFMRP